MKIDILKVGKKIFVTMVDNENKRVEIKSGMSKRKRIIDPKGRAYLKVKSIRGGMVISILDIENDRNILSQIFKGKRGTIKINLDPFIPIPI